MKKLTKAQATLIITKPLKRVGDLVLVQQMSGKEFYSIFTPQLDLSVKIFSSSAYKYIIELYADGGYLVSLATYSLKELAHYYQHKAGIIVDGIAGNVGDSSVFVRDVKISVAKLKESTIEDLINARAGVLLEHERIKASGAAQSIFGRGNQADAVGVAARYIESKVRLSPNKSAKELQSECEKEKFIPVLSQSAFRKHYEQARSRIEREIQSS